MSGTMAFIFKTRYPRQVIKFATETELRQDDQPQCLVGEAFRLDVRPNGEIQLICPIFSFRSFNNSTFRKFCDLKWPIV
jgi:hypothetical protein